MPVFTTQVEDERKVPVMDSVRFYCEGVGEPEVTYEWFYTNGSGKAVLNIYHLM